MGRLIGHMTPDRDWEWEWTVYDRDGGEIEWGVSETEWEAERECLFWEDDPRYASHEVVREGTR